MSKVRQGALPGLLLAITGLLGCQRQLTPRDFLRSYEEEATVSLEREGIKVVLLYQSPDYLAASQGLGADREGAGASESVLDSLRNEYSKAHYFRISLRPMPRAQGQDGKAAGIPDTDFPALQADLGRRLAEVQADLPARIRLVGPEGEIIRPLSISCQWGSLTGAGNSILAVFPGKVEGHAVDPEKFELVVDDLGLKIGTLRRNLAPPKGIRLKVAT